MKIAIDQRILNYILHLKAQPESTLARQAFKILKQLHSIGKDGFYANISNLLGKYNLTIDDISTKTDVAKVITSIRSTYIAYIRNKLEHSPKLDFYKNLKTDYSCEPYLHCINKVIERRNYRKFRISNHNLMIETGRYSNSKTSREQRKCQVCDLDEVENEYHLISICRCYDSSRASFFKNLQNLANIQPPTKIDNNFILEIMRSKDPIVVRLIAKFLSSCFYLRDCKLQHNQ